MRAWADHRQLAPADEALLDHCIQRMDLIYREWWFERNKVKDGQ